MLLMFQNLLKIMSKSFEEDLSDKDYIGLWKVWKMINPQIMMASQKTFKEPFGMNWKKSL